MIEKTMIAVPSHKRVEVQPKSRDRDDKKGEKFDDHCDSFGWEKGLKPPIDRSSERIKPLDLRKDAIW